MEMLEYTPTARPKRARDWKGGLVKIAIDIETGSMAIPAGTVMEVTLRTTRINLRGLPCSCCGISPKVRIDGDDVDATLEWLGVKNEGAIGE